MELARTMSKIVAVVFFIGHNNYSTIPFVEMMRGIFVNNGDGISVKLSILLDKKIHVGIFIMSGRLTSSIGGA